MAEKGSESDLGPMNLKWKVIGGLYTKPFLTADEELPAGVRVDPERPVRS